MNVYFHKRHWGIKCPKCNFKVEVGFRCLKCHTPFDSWFLRKLYKFYLWFSSIFADMVYCKCHHLLPDHISSMYKPNPCTHPYLGKCRHCQCKQFLEISNMEWLSWQGQIPKYKRLLLRFFKKLYAY